MEPREPGFANEDYPNILELVKEGMEVYDRDNDHIGVVEDVFMGTENRVEEETGTGPATSNVGTGSGFPDNTLLEEIADVLSVEDEMPEVVIDRLRQSGFIRVDAGIFDEDLYVVPSQIGSVEGDKVTLRVDKDDLVKE